MALTALTLMNVHVDTVPWKQIAQTLLEVGYVSARMDSPEMALHVQVKYKQGTLRYTSIESVSCKTSNS